MSISPFRTIGSVRLAGRELAPQVPLGTICPSGTPLPTGPALGAVAYLNMLPFFHLGNVPIFRTPRELNDEARAGRVMAACTSAVAGLRAGWKPLAPLLGIGAKGPVHSVFLEPFCFDARDAAAWDSLEGGLENTVTWSKGAHSHPKRGSGGSPEKRIVLFSSGASEHSEWLARTLLGAAGYSLEVIYEPALNAFNESTLRSFVEANRNGAKAALLVIGDPALLRLMHYPHTRRFDLAELWQRATGLPCVFACWFLCGSAMEAMGAEEEKRLASTLIQNLRTWEALDSSGRRDAIRRFFQNQALDAASSQSASFADLPGRDALRSGCEGDSHSRLAFFESYLEGIDFVFNARFEATLSLYGTLLRNSSSFKGCG